MTEEKQEPDWDEIRATFERAEREWKEVIADWPAELRQHADRPMYYDPDGEPISMFEWTKLNYAKREDAGGRSDIPRESWWCRKTFLDGMEVSTVWLGLDHNHLYGRPLTWETMIFGGKKYDHELIERYTTRAQAFDGHEIILRRLRAGRDPWGN